MQILIIFIGLVLAAPTFASQDESYGMGGVSTSRASAVTAEPENPYAALYNPALLAAGSAPQFSISTSAATAKFAPIRGVLLDSRRFRTESGETRNGDYQIPEVSSTLWSLGMTFPFSLSLNHHAGIGVVLGGPYNRLRGYDAGTPYDFSALRYGTSDTQFKGTMSAGLELVPETLFVGAGVSVYVSSAGAADATLFADNPTGRLNVDVGLNTAAVTGLFARLGDNQLGLTFRQAVAPTFTQTFSGKVQVGGTDAFTQPFMLRSSLYYEPHMLGLEWQRDLDFAVVSIGVSYQLWSKYQPSYLVVQTSARDGVRETAPAAPAMRDTWNPRASVEVPFFARRLSVGAGYSYRPSPIKDLSGASNLLDSNTHVFALGIRHHLDAGEIIPTAMSYGVYGQYHSLGGRAVTKTATDFIGAPGYEFSGNVFVYGLSLQAEL